MFTGIIQALGTLRSLEPRGDALRMTINAPGFFQDSHIGDSVANNGVCLTIEDSSADEASFTLIRQTVETSSFSRAKVGSRINLEQACRPESLMGGHYVMGHVDGVLRVRTQIQRETGMEVVLEVPEEFRRYIIQKGSVALDGISLTVAEKTEDAIRVALIPETLEKTNVSSWLPGVPVNLEVDMIGKYVENFLRQCHSC
ncbi:MAG TPA: riboflavin synthase [Fibrobacteraceae bacterium]|nr:riboflavin synthase [Fibrobacteraceae bacterium]